MTPAPRDVLVVVGVWNVRGGLQNRWQRVTAGLAPGRQVTVLTWTPHWRPRSADHGGVRVVHVPCLVPWSGDHSRPVEMLNTVVSVVTGVAAALVLAPRWRVAVGCGLHPEGTVAGLAARVLRRPFFSECWLVGDRGNVGRLQRSVAVRPVVAILRRGRVLLNTATAAGEVVELGMPPHRVCRMPLAVDRSRFRQADGRRRAESRRRHLVTADHVLLYAGRLDLRQKRLDLLLDAWDHVAPAAWELVIAGEGPDAAVVRAQVARCRGRVRLLDWTDAVAELLDLADAVALPTEAESPGNALLEGMASGLPGLASDLAVFRDMAPDGVRLLPNDAEGWRDGVRWLTDLPSARRCELGALAAAWIDSNTSSTEADDLAAVLDG